MTIMVESVAAGMMLGQQQRAYIMKQQSGGTETSETAWAF